MSAGSRVRVHELGPRSSQEGKLFFIDSLLCQLQRSFFRASDSADGGAPPGSEGAEGSGQEGGNRQGE